MAQPKVMQPERVRRRLVVVALSSAGLVAAVMQTLVMPLIPELPKLVHASPTDASWVVTATLLSAAVCTPIGGRLGDMFGKRRILLGTLGLLVIGSLLSALTTSLAPMIAGRVLQGSAMGAIPLGISLMRDILPLDHRASAIAFMSSTMGMGGAIGLPFSAVIAEHYDWHVLFWVAGSLGLLSGAGIALAVPESPIRAGGRFDVVGAIGLSAGLVCGLLAISKGGSWGWTDARVIGLAAATAVIFPIWGWYELRRRGPLVDLRISARREVLLTNAATVMVGFSMYGSVMILPSLLQAPTGSGFGLGQSLLATGLCMAPGGVVMLLASPLSARLTAARDARTTLMTGTAILAVAYLLAPILMSAVWQVVLISVITGCGMALAFSAMPTLIMHSVPEHETAAANGLNALMRSLGTSISSAVMTVLLAGALLGASTGNAHGTGAGIRAFRIAFLVAAGAAALGSVLTLLLPRGTGRAQEPDEIDRELLAATAPGS